MREDPDPVTVALGLVREGPRIVSMLRASSEGHPTIGAKASPPSVSLPFPEARPPLLRTHVGGQRRSLPMLDRAGICVRPPFRNSLRPSVLAKALRCLPWMPGDLPRARFDVRREGPPLHRTQTNLGHGGGGNNLPGDTFLYSLRYIMIIYDILRHSGAKLPGIERVCHVLQ